MYRFSGTKQKAIKRKNAEVVIFQDLHGGLPINSILSIEQLYLILERNVRPKIDCQCVCLVLKAYFYRVYFCICES